jgi:predicted RND superfamily exporter protein
MRDKLLKKLAYLHTKHTWIMLAVVLILTVILGGFAGKVTITMDTKDLLPEGDPKVDLFNQLIDEFSSVTSIIVVAQGKEERIKAFADDLAPKILELIDTTSNAENRAKIAQLSLEIDELKNDAGREKEIVDIRKQIEHYKNRTDLQLFKRVDYKAETEFMRNHALMLVKAEDLQNTKDLFMDPNLTGLVTNLNNSLEKEYVGQEESISTREKEDNAVNFLDGIEQLLHKLNKAVKGEELTGEEVLSAADEFLLGEPYFISYDKTALILNVIPNFSIMDRDLIMVGAERAQSLLDEILKQYPDVTAGLSGDIAREHDEQKASEETLSFTTIIALIAILLLLIISFRMLTAPILAILNLIIGIIWAYGAAYLAVGQLNMMTALLSIVLLGLGIDFSIHLISSLTELRAAGEDILSAMENAFFKSGKGIITGALTTSCAFLALLISQSRGMMEMGLVTGLGLISILLSTFLFLPVMMVFRERYIDRRNKKKTDATRLGPRDISFHSLGTTSFWLGRNYIFTIVASVIISTFLIWSAFQIEYDRNFLSMEPEGLTSIALIDTITEKFDLSMEYALCLADSISESRDLAEEYRDQSIVAMTNDISIYLPSPQEQAKRIPHIRDVAEQMKATKINKNFLQTEIPNFIQEIERLEMNIMEMQDMAFIGGQDKVDNKCIEIVGDPDNPESANIIQKLIADIQADKSGTVAGLTAFQKYFSPYFKENVLKMCSTDPIDLDDLPESVLERYSNDTRDKFMITVYPSAQLYTNTDVLYRFVDATERVSQKTTGGPSVSVAWMRISARDGRNAIMLTLVIVFFLLWIDFRKPWYALMAMIPLGLGAFWMVGIMNLAGMMMNFMTLMGVPLIIGIGIDDGVHIMHRWKYEGEGKLKIIFSSTGKAILLTSATTMLAFGSMIFSVFPAWGWFGGSLFIGVGACFLTTVILLPGIIGWIERKR